MSATVIFILGLAPGLFWLWYFYNRDKFEPEPKSLVIRTFFVGLLIALPAAFLEGLFLWVGPFFLAVIVAPVVEEFCKYLAVRWAVYRHHEFDEPMDGIVYAAAAALGFASIENVVYLLAARSMEDAGLTGTVFVVRALLSVPGHVLFSSIWGGALGRAKFIASPRAAWGLVGSGLLGAMALHGLFNFLAIASELSALLGGIGLLVLMVLAWKAVHRRIHHALAQSPHGPESSKSLAQTE